MVGLAQVDVLYGSTIQHLYQIFYLFFFVSNITEEILIAKMAGAIKLVPLIETTLGIPGRGVVVWIINFHPIS